LTINFEHFLAVNQKDRGKCKIQLLVVPIFHKLKQNHKIDNDSVYMCIVEFRGLTKCKLRI